MRHPNYRLVKIHRSYTVEEAASLLGVHRNTVRAWIKVGLPTTDGKRPTLILGRQLATFLHTRRIKAKRPCRVGEIYCVRCRGPRRPTGGAAEYEPRTSALGDLIAICPQCHTVMYRRVKLATLDQIRGDLTITLAQGGLRIDETSRSSVNSDLRMPLP